MSKYFFDTEFITGFKKPSPFLPTIGKWNKKEFYIHLVSIGIVDESGREYSAISNEFDPNLADNWVKENVLYPIIRDNGYRKNLQNIHGVSSYSKSAIKQVQKWHGKSNLKIRNEIIDFMGGGQDDNSTQLYVPSDTEIYGYYADYDWVVFCSLFGRMIDLPSGMPMYCKDIKQILDDCAENMSIETCKEINKMVYPEVSHNVLSSLFKRGAKERLSILKMHEDYPKQENEHSALDDAKWNKRLYEFIKEL